MTSQSQQRVLVVDDDEDIRDSMSLILESTGYTVLTASNGAVALEHLRREAAPCVILLDLMMPVMNGWQFLTELANDASLPEVPIVILTGDIRAAEQAPSLGVAEFILKPIELGQLISIIQQYC